MAADTDIELKVSLDNKDAVQRSKELQNEIQKTLNKIDTSKMDAKTMASVNRLNKLSQKASEIQEKMKDISGAKIDTTEYDNLTKQLEEANKNFDYALDKQMALEQSGEATTDQIAAARQETDFWADSIASIEQQMKDIEASMESAKQAVPTPEYDALKTKLEELYASFDKALDKQEELESSEWAHPEQIREAREETDKWAGAIEEVRNEMAELEQSGKAYEAPEDHSAEYEKLAQQLDDVNNQMDVQIAKQNEVSGGLNNMRISANNAFGRIFNQFSQGVRAFEQMQQGAQALGPAIDSAMSGATTGMAAFKNIAGAAMPVIGGITTGVGLLVTAVMALVKAIDNAVQAMAQLQGMMMRKLATSVPILKDVFGILGDPEGTKQKIKDLSKTILSVLGKMGNSIAKFGKSGISTAINNIKSSIRQGIASLEQWQIAMGNTTNSISALKGSLDLLKTNIGAAFAPILDAIAPTLLQLTSILNQATIAIGSFFAALGGKTKILVAKSTTASLTNASTATQGVSDAANDSVDSLNNSYEALAEVGDGAEKAGGQLQDFLGSYDELNVISKQSGGGGGAGGGANISADFEEIEIGEDIIELANMIRDAWDKADFTEIGEMLGKKLIAALDVANDWIKRYGEPTAVKIGKSIATLLNGFFEAKDENGKSTGTAIGEFLGNALDMVISGVRSFLLTIHANSVGQFVVDAINAFLKNDKLWKDLGDVIVVGINKAIEFGNTLLKPENEVFKNLGKNVSDLIKRAVVGGENGEAGINFEGLGELIANGISSQVNFVYEILKDRNTFYVLGEKLGESLNAMQTALDDNNTWTKIGLTLSNGLKDIFLTLGGFLKTWNWKQLADGLAEGINGAINSLSVDDAKYFVSTMYQLQLTLQNTLERTLSQINANKLGKTLAGALEGMNIQESMESFSRLAHTIVSKLLDTLITAVKQLEEDGQFENFGAQVYNGMHSVDWSDVMGKLVELLQRVGRGALQGLWGYLKEAIKSGLRNVIDTIFGWLPDEVREAIKDKMGLLPAEVNANVVDAGKVIGSDFADGVTTGTNEGLAGVPEDVRQKMSETKLAATTELDGLASDVKPPIEAAGNTITSSLEDTKTESISILDVLKGGVVGTLTQTKDDSKIQVDALSSNTTSSFEGMRDKVVGSDGNGGVFNTIFSAITGGASDTKTKTVQDAKDLNTDVQAEISDLQTKTTGDGGTFTQFKDKMSEIAANLNRDVSKEMDAMGTKVQTTAATDIGIDVPHSFEEARDRIVGRGKTDTSATVPNITETTNDCFDELKEKLIGTAGLVPEIKDKTEDAFNKLKEALVGSDGKGGIANAIKEAVLTAFDNLKAGLQSGYINAAKDLESFVNTSIVYINKLIDAYRALATAKAAAGAGGGGVGSILAGAFAQVPRLATGAVIPPNQPFLAMLGDQHNGTNVEAPLSTIQEAVANVLEPYLAQIAQNTEITANKDFSVKIGDRDIARANTRGARTMGLTLRTH